MDARMALLQAVAVGPVGGGRLPSSRPVSASTPAPEQAVAMVAPAPYQRRSQATSGDRSWSSDASLPTLSSGTTTTSGARQSSQQPSGVTVQPLPPTRRPPSPGRMTGHRGPARGDQQGAGR